jgi:hypothetical protein
VIYVLGTDGNWYRWNSTYWSNVGSSDPSGSSGGGGGGGGTSGTSPSGTRSPSIIVDDVGATWTIGSGSAILRNGAQANGGYGSQILWYSGVIYVLGTDSNWYRWNGTYWSGVGSSDPSGSSGGGGGGGGTSGTSPSGTRTPPAGNIVDDAGATWTIGSGSAILRNGSQANGGYGSQILWYSGVIYVLGTDGNWYRWNSTYWSNMGSSDPAGGATAPPSSPSPNGTRVPRDASQIVDSFGHTWTLKPNSVCPSGDQEILKDSARPVQGFASCGTVILFLNGNVYVMRDDNQWYLWNESGKAWNLIGATAPDTAGSTVQLLFTPSSNDATNVTSYSLNIFTAGANPSTAKPAGSQALGKPPLVDGDMVVDVSSLIATLPSGTYFATVTAIGPGGTAQSASSNTFAR